MEVAVIERMIRRKTRTPCEIDALLAEQELIMLSQQIKRQAPEIERRIETLENGGKGSCPSSTNLK